VTRQWKSKSNADIFFRFAVVKFLEKIDDAQSNANLVITLAKCCRSLRLTAHLNQTMDLNNLNGILAQATSPAAGATQPNPTGDMMRMILTFALFGVIFYFVLIRPQQKRAKQQAEMLKSVRPGDKVVTSGGIVGVVVTVKEKTLTIRSGDAKMEITKAAVGEIVERSGESSES
jgi:preprotein translocase subunit YajC